MGHSPCCQKIQSAWFCQSAFRALDCSSLAPPFVDVKGRKTGAQRRGRREEIDATNLRLPVLGHVSQQVPLAQLLQQRGDDVPSVPDGDDLTLRLPRRRIGRRLWVVLPR
jgi:hypothetical protein